MKELGINIGIVNDKVIGTDGKPVVNKKAIFKFWSDEETSSKIVSAFPTRTRKFKGDGRAVVIELPVDVADKFIGGKFWSDLMAEYGKFGYQSNKTPEDVKKQMEFSMNQAITPEDSKKVMNDFNSYIDDIVNGLERDFNDPRFKSLMSNVAIIGTKPNGEGGYIFNKFKPTPRNLIMMLTQWRKAGRQGHPTFVTTRNIWFSIFERDVVPSAVRMLAVRPSNVTGQTENDALNQMGITKSDAENDAALKFALGKYMADKNFGKFGSNNLGGGTNLIAYYDVSDTELMPQAVRDYFQDVINAGNADNGEIMKDGMQGSQKGDEDASMENVPENESALWKGIVRYANESGDKTIRSMIAAKRDLFSVLTALVSEESDIDREHDANKKAALTNSVLFALCKHYGVFEDRLGYLYKNGVKFINSINGNVNRERFLEIMPYVYNVIEKIGNIGIKESMSLLSISELIYEGNDPMFNVSYNFNNILNRMALTD